MPKLFSQHSRIEVHPKPPSSFWWHNLSHDCKCIPQVLPPELHQTWATSLISFFVIVFGIQKEDITWFGNVVTTEFIITFFPSFVKNLKVQSLTLLLSRSWTKLNICVFEPPMLSGNPKYDPMMPIFGIRNMSMSSCLIDSSILCPNCIDDFWKFISCPDATSHSFIILKMVWHLCFFSLHKNRLSSAKRRWEIDRHCFPNINHVGYFFLSTF